MKKTFKRSDGSEEILEGTAEELAEYEKRLRDEDRKAKKGILKGSPEESLEEILKKISPYISPHIPNSPLTWPTTDKIWIGQTCQYCGRISCACAFPYPTIIYGQAS